MALILSKDALRVRTKTLQVKDLMDLFAAMVETDLWVPDTEISITVVGGHIWLEVKLDG